MTLKDGGEDEDEGGVWGTVGAPNAPEGASRSEPVVVTKAYEMVRWLHERSARFPRQYRFGLADRVQKESLEMLSLLVDASYRRERGTLIDAASRSHARLRVLVRLARGLGCLSTKQYVYSMAPLDEVGKMIGGWLRHETVSRNRGARS